MCSVRLNFLRAVPLVVLLAAPSFVAAEGSENAYSSQTEPAKVTVGVVEDVILTPWGIRFPARIDTGADLSSLDAREITVQDDIAKFKLGKRFGGLQLQLPVLEWRRIQTATGTEKRPVVEISICLGSKVFRTLATLKDRSQMMYPFLVGRSALSENFLVDPSRSKPVQLACPAGALAANQVPSVSTKE